MSAAAGGARAAPGRRRTGTGGRGRRRLEGKGPTPPAELRPGHPAQRRAAARASAGKDAGGGPGAGAGRRAGGGPGTGADRGAGTDHRAGGAPGPRGGAAARGAGDAAEVVAGRNAVLESLRAAVPALALHLGTGLDADDRIGEAVRLAADGGIPVVEAGRAGLDRLTGGAVHQGIALRIRPYSYAHPDDLPGARGRHAPLIVALDGITDPRNLGAVARSVAAFGGDGVLIPARRSAGVTAGAWKASAGALAKVPVARAPNLAGALAGYARQGLFIVGLDPAGADDIARLPLATEPLVLVIGSEGRGLSRLVRRACDTLARIPITGTESLNAAVAAGIALYQVAAARAVAAAGEVAAGRAGS